MEQFFIIYIALLAAWCTKVITTALAKTYMERKIKKAK